VNGLNLRVVDGEFLAIMGPSGSGKSKLIQLLAGLTKPDAGILEVAGMRLLSARDSQLALLRRTKIGLVFQSSNLLPRLTVRENVELPLLLSGRRPLREWVDTLLSSLGLAERDDHLPGDLSGGEQQRVAVARALVHDPGLILADEPTGSLDSENTRGLCKLFVRLRNQGRAIVVTTHNRDVAAHADRIVFMRDGRLADDA
jgi:putative ABC transport system ATP-binding protein